MYNPKNTPLENLQNEIASEKYSTLRTIIENLSNCLDQLETLDKQINDAMDKSLSPHDINKMIETFNKVRDTAEELQFNLCVTREASGFFHNNLASNIYKIPPRKILL
jgi:hypothetical protein